MVSRLSKLWRNESGITTMETAIILIAFVVVASVFAFPILSAGGTSSTKKAETEPGLVELADGTREIVEEGQSNACKVCLWAEDAENCTGVCGAVSEEGE